MAQFECTTTAQVERTYHVEADDEAQARKRLRIHFQDADLLRAGVVAPVPDRMTNKTDERITNVQVLKDEPAVASDGSATVPETDGGGGTSAPEPTRPRPRAAARGAA